jgi:uncharacterized membrane protein YfcA
VLLPAGFVFADEMMSTGRADPDHVMGTLLVAVGIGAIALAVTRIRGDRAALLSSVVLGLGILIQGYALVGAVRPQLRQPLTLVSMALLASYLFWSARRRFREHR